MNNITQMKQRRNIFITIIILVIIAIVGTSVWFLQIRTATNQHAAASTTLAFTPLSQSTNTGQQISSDITVDPGTNHVSLIKLVLTYNGSQLQIASDASSLTINTAAFPQTLQPPATTCNGTKCTLTATISIGSDPTKAIQTKATLATLHATVLAATQTSVTVGFDPTTAVYSVASTDQASENVLSSSVPLTFVVGGASSPTPSTGVPTPTQAGICSMDTATCAWDNLSTATAYHYKVTDVTTGNVIKEGGTTPPQSSIDFPQQPGDTYKCEVSASNACKTDATVSTTNTCPVSPTPSATPTQTVTPTITLTPTPTPTPGPTETPQPTPVVCSGSCTSNSNCQSGLSCIGGLCKNAACSTNSTCSCGITQPPQPPQQPFVPTSPPQYIAPAQFITATPVPQAPKMLPTGPGDTFIKIGAVGAALAIVGGLLIFGL